jgi:parallel beta-helix repeat protein
LGYNALLFALIVTLILLCGQSTVIVRGESRTWIVDSHGGGDYRTIQQAINAAQTGDTVFVHAGIYPEQVTISKSINLIGEDSDNTVIDGKNFPISSIVNIYANHVSLTGFKIARFSQYAIDISANDTNVHGNNIEALAPVTSINGGLIVAVGLGIEQGVTRNLVNQNNLVNVHIAFSLQNTYDNILENNNLFMAKDAGIGIVLYNSTGNIITNNIIEAPESCLYGLAIDLSNNNRISNNIVTGNYGSIFEYSSAYRNLMVNNTFAADGNDTIMLANSYENIFYGNNFQNHKQRSIWDLYMQNNTWDNGYPSGGNFWIMYEGNDVFSGPNQDIEGSDGIGDVAFYGNGIAGSILKDRYPLMTPTIEINGPPIPYRTPTQISEPQPSATAMPTNAPAATTTPTSTPKPTVNASPTLQATNTPSAQPTQNPTETPPPASTRWDVFRDPTSAAMVIVLALAGLMFIVFRIRRKP